MRGLLLYLINPSLIIRKRKYTNGMFSPFATVIIQSIQCCQWSLLAFSQRKTRQAFIVYSDIILLIFLMSSRTLFITGANRGISFSMLQGLALRLPSDRYLLGARNEEQGREAVSRLRDLGVEAEIHVIPLDVSSESSIKSAEQTIRTNHKTLDILINNAAIGRLDHSNIQETYYETFQTNVTGVALMMSTFLPLLKETSSDPRIINISSARGSLHLSTTGQLPLTTSISYCVSKSAPNALTIE